MQQSLCYCCHPDVFDRLRSGEKQSIVVVVNPLIAQVAEYCFMGLNAAYVNVKHGNEGMQQGVLEGKYQPVFMSPESLLLCGNVERKAILH